MEILLFTNTIIIILALIGTQKGVNKTVKTILVIIAMLATIGVAGYFLGKAIFYITN
ncbi:hypothetical protein [Galbibacter mesophilus]|uniref:hypothetical protein n=1 Tax=Galbibacter mesophilus TaxID=379069 RepID=UPI00191F52DF|nr:hypothetical protein [Galbibacter mesophilus]MCM5662426.1 hypothetical protein [Galbibacter mesophilus]